MITLDLPLKTEQMIIEYAEQKGISVQQYILSKLDPELALPKVHSDWIDFVELQNKLYNEDPNEFETFDFARDLRCPQERDLG